MYRWFVYSDINTTIESEIIAPMAQLLIDNDFEVAPVIKALLRSQHFHDAFYIGPMIKNPMDFVVGLYRQFNLLPEASEIDNFANYFRLASGMRVLQMLYFEPPNVAGWKAYYQKPAYYQTWISSATLAPRMQHTDQLATTGIVFRGQRFQIDVLAIASTIENGINPNELIQGLAKILYPQALSEKQIIALKEILIPGLPDFEWTVEYSDYLTDPTNDDLRTSIKNRLRALFKAMLAMPEYYLM